MTHRVESGLVNCNPKNLIMDKGNKQKFPNKLNQHEKCSFATTLVYARARIKQKKASIL